MDYYSNEGVLRSSQVLSVSREGIPIPGGYVMSTPRVEVLVNEDRDGPVKLFLANYRRTLRPFIIDQFGDVRWYTHYQGAYGLQQSHNGNILVATGPYLDGETPMDGVLEFSLDGRVVRTYTLPRPYNKVHHDIHELRNGDLLLTVNSDELETVEDVIVLMDRNLGQIKRVWDLNASIPRNYELIRDTTDWLHVNAVTLDERDKSLILSARASGLFKVSWDNELKWILSGGRGFENHREFMIDAQHEVFWGQHDIQLDEQNDVYYVFDNGYARHYSGLNKYSRGVKFTVDEATLTSTQIQEYGADLPEYYAPFISGIAYRDDGNVLLNFGALGFDCSYTNNVDRSCWRVLDRGFGAAWVEYDMAGTMVFHARFSHPREDGFEAGMYRARYVDLFKGF